MEPVAVRVLDSGFYMVPAAQWGFASSPVIHDNMLIIQADVQEDSFLAALDIEAGKELWRTPRNDVPRTAGTAWHNAHGKDYIDETNRSRIEQI